MMTTSVSVSAYQLDSVVAVVVVVAIVVVGVAVVVGVVVVVVVGWEKLFSLV